MTTFRQLQAIRAQVNRIPGIRNYKDFDIVVEIGYRHKEGDPLTLKQLLLLNIASAATVRRHLSRLVREGIVIKSVAPHDHRSTHFLLSEAAIKNLEACLTKIHHTLCDGRMCQHDR